MEYIEAFKLQNKVNCVEALASSLIPPSRTTPPESLESTVVCMRKVNNGGAQAKNLCYIVDGSNCPLGLKPKT